jgi:hypothetical protein
VYYLPLQAGRLLSPRRFFPYLRQIPLQRIQVFPVLEKFPAAKSVGMTIDVYQVSDTFLSSIPGALKRIVRPDPPATTFREPGF